jgi:hypothetical protein
LPKGRINGKIINHIAVGPTRRILRISADMRPKLPPPNSHLFRLDKALQDQITLGLEKVDLAFVQHRQVDSPDSDSMVCKTAFR